MRTTLNLDDDAHQLTTLDCRNERLLAMPPHEKLACALRLSAMVRRAMMADVRSRNSGATEEQVKVAFIRRAYGNELAEKFARRRRR